MNIALLDLNHMTMGVHTNTVPLGISLIAYYLKNHVKHDFDIKLFKNFSHFLDVLEDWVPDILGIAQYVWNSELNLYMAKIVKQKNPECVVVAGGPNLYLSSTQKYLYLKKNNYVDVCVAYDGEIPFAEIVKRRINGEKIQDIKSKPVIGSYSIDEKQDKLVESEDSPKLNSLDVFGAMYAEGLFDEFLDEGFHPFVQTQRGCPFKCLYCHSSDDYYSNVIFQSVNNFKKDMEYLGKRYAGKHNVILFMANTNFGLFKEDFEIARVIRTIQDKYDWPKIFNVNSGKKPDKLLELLSVLKYKFIPAIALQTLTPQVLRTIKRINIPFEDFVNFQKKVIGEIGESTITELILSLPEETKESFLETLSQVLNSGVQNIVIYTLMALKGTPIAALETAEKYQHIIKHRIVQRCFSQLNDAKILETEEVIVGTKSMSYEDYINLRGLALIVTVFASSVEMFPIRKFLIGHDLDVAQWIFNIHNKVSFYPSFYEVYKSFLDETEDELFASREEVVEFFSKQENYDLLCAGKLGDNLLRKYKTLILSNHYKEAIKIALDELRIMIKNYLAPKQLDIFVEDLRTYLETRDIAHIFRESEKKEMSQRVILHYDIPKWLSSGNDKFFFEKYKGMFPYSIVITDYIRNRMNSFSQIAQDKQFSLQILYRDGYIKDFWPLWVKDD